jgi:imidazolonepropionase-like amidohydrolase
MQGNDAAGLVDAHVHLARDGWKESAMQAGVAAVRDAGLKPVAGGARRTSGGELVLVSSCWALYKAGGYGSRFGLPLSTMGSVKTEIGKLKQAGADIIKVMASGMVSLKDPGTVTAGGFDREELRVLVREAAAAGLAVMAHANGEEAIMAAADAGVRSIEHGFFMTERALDLLAGKAVYWVPTTGALARAANVGASAAARRFVADLVQQHLRMLALAHGIGVPLAVGTDFVLPAPGYRNAYEAELAYFREAGISEDAVLKIASEGGARLLGFSSAEFGARSNPASSSAL